jgi:hypothetical protein
MGSNTTAMCNGYTIQLVTSKTSGLPIFAKDVRQSASLLTPSAKTVTCSPDLSFSKFVSAKVLGNLLRPVVHSRCQRTTALRRLLDSHEGLIDAVDRDLTSHTGVVIIHLLRTFHFEPTEGRI